MKRYFALIILFLTMLFSGCVTTKQVEEFKNYRNEILGDDFFTINEDNNNRIYVHKETKVMYFYHASGNSCGITVMLNEDGKPLLYKE